MLLLTAHGLLSSTFFMISDWLLQLWFSHAEWQHGAMTTSKGLVLSLITCCGLILYGATCCDQAISVMSLPLSELTNDISVCSRPRVVSCAAVTQPIVTVYHLCSVSHRDCNCSLYGRIAELDAGISWNMLTSSSMFYRPIITLLGSGDPPWWRISCQCKGLAYVCVYERFLRLSLLIALKAFGGQTQPRVLTRTLPF